MMGGKPPQPLTQMQPQQPMGAGGGEGLAAQIAGMSKNQLYEIMCQMKNLIEQNPQQARQILIGNPKLTKALFQAQIMLGMVQPPKVPPTFQQGPAQASQKSTHIVQQNIQPPQPTISQPQVPARQQVQQPMSIPPASISPLVFQSQSMPPVQVKRETLTPAPSHHNLPPPPISSHSLLQAHNMPLVSGQSMSPMIQPLQRPNFPQPPQTQMPPGIGFHVAGGQQHMLPPSTFHSGPAGSFPGSQPPRQRLYQGASEFSLLPGPPLPTMTSQPPPRPQQLTAEMEQALLQQVMSLTPEQISQLPPEHRRHVIQIQQMYQR